MRYDCVVNKGYIMKVSSVHHYCYFNTLLIVLFQIFFGTIRCKINGFTVNFI